MSAKQGFLLDKYEQYINVYEQFIKQRISSLSIRYDTFIRANLINVVLQHREKPSYETVCGRNKLKSSMLIFFKTLLGFRLSVSMKSIQEQRK